MAPIRPIKDFSSLSCFESKTSKNNLLVARLAADGRTVELVDLDHPDETMSMLLSAGGCIFAHRLQRCCWCRRRCTIQELVFSNSLIQSTGRERLQDCDWKGGLEGAPPHSSPSPEAVSASFPRFLLDREETRSRLGSLVHVTSVFTRPRVWRQGTATWIGRHRQPIRNAASGLTGRPWGLPGEHAG